MTAHPVGPLQTPERHEAIDLLRGFGVLGILMINIQLFSMPFAMSVNPTALGDRGTFDFAIWVASHLFFDQKFMTIFSLLFGAGILIMTSRAENRSGRSAALHYRRMLWLLVFGLLHAYLIWYGDILVLYAVCGFIVYLFRWRDPRGLFVLGLLVLSVESVLMISGGLALLAAPPEAQRDIVGFWAPGPLIVQEELAAFQAGWLAQMPMRFAYSLDFHAFELWTWGIWRAGGLMLLGMALCKWRVLTGERSTGFYTTMAVAGFLIGLPIVAFGVWQMNAWQWEAVRSYFFGMQFNYWGSLLVSCGWIGLFLLLWKRGSLGKLATRVIAVGRTAFSCYILTSIICTFVFYGHGIGLFGRMGRPGQLLVTLAVWITLLIVASPGLQRFHFGPLEWLWRSLTYGERQPMRRRDASVVPAL
jgi:uncharacterized protein